MSTFTLAFTIVLPDAELGNVASDATANSPVARRLFNIKSVVSRTDQADCGPPYQGAD